MEKFSLYIKLLAKWARVLNLVAEGEDLKQRHFADSMALMPYLGGGDSCADVGGNGREEITDVGSGAGFPGMVLAIAGLPVVRLVEADSRKYAFLEEVKRAYGLDVEIVNARVESITGFAASVITARAFAPLGRLFELCGGICLPGTRFVLLKGVGVEAEIAEASARWRFEHSIHKKPGGFVLECHNVGLK
ncbi:MAG: 16S rRNA (guanine(527)-N(7))-methyltransferase RsmG [Rickettsiales bacterium]|jgi:16S rRNA (guanine527-N7)-methyltransferase|nr:16S rRNA (guanine(527)-N(7))-methyltransferase RsmG [Rickettsiales bacterium]